MADQQENEIGEWTIDASNTSSETVKSSSVSSTFKVLGEIDAPYDAAVLGHTTSTSGTATGVEGPGGGGAHRLLGQLFGRA